MPLADATVVKAPEDIADSILVLMADIFPTGYFAAHNAFKDMSGEQIKEATVVVIGCGYDFVHETLGLYKYCTECSQLVDPSVYAR